MKAYLSTFVLSALILSIAVPLSVAEDISLLPMYGGLEKTAEQKKDDAKFMATVTKLAGTQQKASDQLVEKGFAALGSGDSDTAMRRFNQAYLLAPQSTDAQWGLGAASAARGHFDDSVAIFEKLVQLQPPNARLLNDYAFVRINKALSIPSEDQAFEQFQKADELLHKAEIADPAFDRTYFNFATISYYKGDFTEAWKNVEKSEKYGGKALDPRLVKDLEKVMPRPTGK